MKVTGFTIIKNAIKYDFPIVEAIRSILPVCDDFVVAVGNSEDATRELIASIDPKIRIIDTVWNMKLNVGGAVLADETNKAFQAIGADTDWCFYIQGDEVMHEKYLDTVYKAMQQWKDDKRVDGLLFKYHHFYGSYDYVGASSKWYRKEIRIIKNDKSIYSYLDAQGFRKGDNEKLNVKELDAYIYHYGWVREPEMMNAKILHSGVYWLGSEYNERTYEHLYEGGFDYSKVDKLDKFRGTHPAVIQERIGKMNWKFEHDLTYNNLRFKDKMKDFVEKLTGRRLFDYKNYNIIR